MIDEPNAPSAAQREAGPSLPWHSLPVRDVLIAAGTQTTGLSEASAAARLIEYGPNRLAVAKPVSAATIFKDQLSSVVVFLLAIAATISVALGDYLEASTVVAVLVINTAMGFATEWRARRAMDALRSLEVPRATVGRNGQLQIVDAETLVPGDSHRSLRRTTRAGGCPS